MRGIDCAVASEGDEVVSEETDCPAYCSRDRYYYRGYFDTFLEECSYSDRLCDYGCDERGTDCASAPLTEDSDTGDVVSEEVSCDSYCSRGRYYYDGYYDRALEECSYSDRLCEHSCNARGTDCIYFPMEEQPSSARECPDYCSDGIQYYRGVYDRESGECEYNYREECEFGCNLRRDACVSAPVRDCPAYCENNLFYPMGEYDFESDECFYNTRGPCDFGCNGAGTACERGIVTARPFVPPTASQAGSVTVSVEDEEEEIGVAVEENVFVEVDESNNLRIRKQEKEFVVEQNFGRLVSRFARMNSSVQKLDIMVKEDKPVYSVTRTRQARLFGIFSMPLQVSTLVDATDLQVIEEIKPWWSFLFIIPEEEETGTEEESGSLEETVVEGELACEIQHDAGVEELFCPESTEAEEIPSTFPLIEGEGLEFSEGVSLLDSSDSETSDFDSSVIENNPSLIDLSAEVALPANLSEFPKISPTLLDMYNFVANNCLNDSSNELCPSERIYYFDEVNSDTKVELELELNTMHTNIDEYFTEIGGELIYFNDEKPVLIGSIGIGRLMNLNDRAEVSYISRFVPTKEFWDLDDDAINFVHLNHLRDVGQDGDGVKIAVIDLGFKDYLVSQANGNLPANLHYKNFLTSADNKKNHGRKCAEVVHAVAPKAELYLYRVSGYDAWKDAVEEAIAEEVDIISSSIGYSASGPGNGTGWINEVVKQAADAGILYFQSAANDQKQYYHFDYSDPTGDKWLNLAPGDETNHYFLNKDQNLSVSMRYNQWGVDGKGDAEDNFDLHVFREKPDGELELLISSKNNDPQPYEHLKFTAPADGFYHVAVKEKNKTTNGNVVFSLFYSKTHPEYESVGREIGIPSDSPHVITVGAIHEGGVLAGYSSRGPTMDGRVKPDFSAPSGFVLPAGGNAIAGTSFSTPFLAGAAAVLGELDFSKQDEIYKIFKYMTFYQDKSMDNSFGWGVPNFDHTFNNATCGWSLKNAALKVYCNKYPVYVRKTGYASLQLKPGTFEWNGSNNESKEFVLTDGSKLLLEYPKWHGLFLDTSGKGHPKVFDIVPKEGDNDVHYNMEKAGIMVVGLHKKQGETGKQPVWLTIKNN